MKRIISALILLIGFTSCKKELVESTPNAIDSNIKNILILGNSITYSPENLSIGWKGNWGMAASAPEFDYVHLLAAQFKNINPNSNLIAKNISKFEREYSTYNYKADLKELKDSKPDLIIIRIGENVDITTIKTGEFEKKYVDLLSYFKENNPTVKILAVGSFWDNTESDSILSKYSKFVSLRTLVFDTSNQALGQFSDSGVSVHPSDKGMKAISELIWRGISGI